MRGWGWEGGGVKFYLFLLRIFVYIVWVGGRR